METEQLQALFNHLPDAIYLIDPETSKILACNQRGLDDLQLDAEEVINHSVLTLQKDVRGLPAWSDIAATIRSVEVYTFVGRHVRKDGGQFPVEVNTSVFHHEDREYFLSVARDITRRRMHEQDLLDRESTLWFALNEASDGLWDWNIQTGEVYFSPQLKRMLGYGPDEMKPHVNTWSNNIHPDDLPRVMSSLNGHLTGKRERYDIEYRLKNRNGHYIWVHDRGRVSDHDTEGEPARAIGMVQNVTDRKALEAKLQEMASIDMLTGLMNRRQGELIFEQQLDLSRRLGFDMGVCLFDLDGFKQINDELGHLKGDDVLKQVVEIVRSSIRKSDHFYRWGGEEFVLVLPNTNQEQLQKLAEKVRLALAEFDWRECLGLGRVTASFGLALSPKHGTTTNQLFLNADAAMFQAKSQGRNCCVVASANGKADHS